MDKTKIQRDYEEKLIVSAWYNMVRRNFFTMIYSWDLLSGRESFLEAFLSLCLFSTPLITNFYYQEFLRYLEVF